MPRLREAMLVAALIAGLICLFNYEVIFLGRTFVPLQSIGVAGSAGAYNAGPYRPDYLRLDPSATILQNFAWTPEIRRQARAGAFPLWNPYQGFGSPLHANAIPAILNPFQWPKVLDNSLLTWDLTVLARTMLGALAAYLYARLLGFTPAARAMVVVAYTFCGHFLLFDHNAWLEAYLILPVILIGQELILRGSLRSGAAVIAVAVAWQLVVGMPEISLAVFLFAAAYGGFGLLHGFRAAGWRRSSWLPAIVLAASWLAGIGMAAPLLIPMFELVGEAGSVSGYRAIYGLDFAGVNDLALWVMPYLFRLPYLPPLQSMDDVRHGLHYVATFAGAGIVISAIYGALSAPRTPYRRLGLFLSVSVALILAKSYGLPGLNEVGRLPGLSITHIPKWFGPVVNFCLAMLAGIGVHDLDTSRREGRAWHPHIAAAVVAALVALGLATNREAIAVTAAAAPEIRALPWFSVGTALAFGGLMWAMLRFRPRFGGISTGAACVILVCGELFLLAPRGVHQDRRDPYQPPPFADYVLRQPDGATARVYGMDTLLFPNTATVFGIPDIRVLDALIPDRYLSYIREFISPGSETWFTGIEGAGRGTPPSVRSNPWFDLTGARYLLGLPDVSGRLFAPLTTSSFLSGVDEEKVRSLDASAGPMTVDGTTRDALRVGRSGTLATRVMVPPDATRISFAVAAVPSSGRERSNKPDRITISVSVGDDEDATKLFERELTYSPRETNPGWVDGSADLSAFSGKTVTLRFAAKTARDEAFDAFGLADLQFVGQDPAAPPQFTVAATGEDGVVLVNGRAATRAFLVRDVRPVATEAEAIALMRSGAFDPDVTAVVEGEPGIPATGPGDSESGAGTARISVYEPTLVAVEVNAPEPALLVLTDLFYPGWSATVDGQPAPIYATDLAFRGVAVPAGEHTVVFTYAPASFRLGAISGLAGAAVLLLVAVGPPVFRRLRDGREQRGRDAAGEGFDPAA